MSWSGGTNARRARMLVTLATGNRVTAGLLALGVVVVVAMFGASGAWATTGHSYAGQFGAAGQGNGELGAGGPGGVAVRQSTGDVFVSDPGHTLGDGTPAPRIERFDAGGAFQGSFPIDAGAFSNPGALAVDQAGGGAVYVSVISNSTFGGAVAKYSAAGVFQHVLDVGASGTALSYGGSVAVDPANGTVYAAASDTTTGANVIDSFDASTGAFVARFDGSVGSPDGGFVCPGLVAVDASHRVYVADGGCKGRVDRYSAAGVFEATVDAGSVASPGAVTVAPASGEVFIAESGPNGPQVAHFSAGGASRIFTFGPPRIAGVAGLAVNDTTGAVYVADNASGVVERFAAFVGPTVTTTAAASIGSSSATLNGTVNPNSVPATFHFDYGLDASYGASTADQSAGSGGSADPASDAATGLLANTTYHYRIVGSNASGAILGNDQTFTTALAAPTVDGSPAVASSITPTAATLNATVNPQGSPTTFHFEYGTTTAYGSTAPTTPGDAGSGQGDATVSAPVTGLTPGSVYHFRVVADNGTGGAQNGADQTFKTAPATAPTADAVTAAAATLTGTVDPHGSTATYHFNYGTTSAYGTSTPTGDTAGGGVQSVTASIAGLAPSTTYHFQVVATDIATGVNTSSDDATFTTAPAAVAVATDATAVTTDRATLNGTIDTHGLPATYRFRITSSTSPYSATTPEQSLDAGAGARPVSATLTDLQPGGRYLARLLVSSNGASSLSDEVAVLTAPVPAADPPRPAQATAAYGCVSPTLNAYNAHPRAGTTIAITGSDLGVGGTVMLGDTRLGPDKWSATGFSITLPDDATGALPLTVNCGQVSNTIAIAIASPPSSKTTTKAKTKNGTATLTITVPGPGKLSVSGDGLTRGAKTVKAKGKATIKVTLTKSSKTALKKAKSRRLTRTATVSFTPTGATTPGTTKVTLTFTRGGTR
jgi:hypothetical protein